MSLLENKRVFIIEDKADNREIMSTLLEQAGAVVVAENWGKDLFNKMTTFLPVDIILLDLMYPYFIDGYGIHARIAGNPEFKSIPVVAVSAADASIAIPRTRSNGFQGYIAKPVDFDLFPQQVAQVIAGQSIWYTG